MKQLEQCLERIAALRAESTALGARRDELQAGIDSASRRGKLSKSELGELGAAVTEAQTLPVQLRRLEERLVGELDALPGRMEAAARAWNNFVGQKGEEEFERFIEAVNPFFGGEEKERLTRREFESLHVPSVAAIRNCAAETGDFRRLSPEKQESAARQFLAHVYNSCSRHGWNVEGVEGAAAPKLSIVDLDGKVTVRAVSGIHFRQVQQHPGRAPKRIEPAVEGVMVDDLFIPNGQEAVITRRQYLAASRFLELVQPEPQRKVSAKGGLAAMALGLLFLLIGGAQALAQYNYGLVTVVGTNSLFCTNFISATAVTNFNVPSITTNAQTQISVNLSNGQPVFSYSTNYTYLTNTPGVVNLTHWDSAPIQMSFALAGAGTQPVTAFWIFSNDGQNWATNSVIEAVTAAGTATVAGSTNLGPSIFGSIGYLRLDAVTNANGNALTNLLITISKKPIRAGS
jgi:hypothetical protein